MKHTVVDNSQSCVHLYVHEKTLVRTEQQLKNNTGIIKQLCQLYLLGCSAHFEFQIGHTPLSEP